MQPNVDGLMNPRVLPLAQPHSFEDNADEEIDTTVIEEEDWIEYIKRSTEDAMEKMAHAKIRCWNRTQKNEMEIGTENCNITE